MTYKKMTVDDFKARLKNGDYKDATGARRGAGKADLNDAEKDQCRRAIDKHFGTESAAPVAKDSARKKVKAPSNKKVVAKKAASNGKAEKPNGVVKRGRRRRVQAQSAEGTPQLSANDNELLSRLHLAKERIGTVTQAVETMKRAKEAYPSLDTRAGMEVAAVVLTQVIQGVHDSMNGKDVDIDPQVMEALRQTAPAAVGLPGHPSPVQMPQQTVGQAPPQDISSIS